MLSNNKEYKSKKIYKNKLYIHKIINKSDFLEIL